MSSQRESRTSTFMRLAPWASGLVLIAGVVSALVVFVGRDDGSDRERAAISSAPQKPAAKPEPVTPAAQKKVPLDPKAREVAGRFILTNVTRQNLAEGWTLAGPEVRQGMTRKEWLTGNIPVPYYPADAIDQAPISVAESTPGQAYVEIAVLAKPGAKVKGQLYVIGVKAIGTGKSRRWVVNYFSDKSSYGRPQAEQQT